jgi:membrane-associated phospholipid phosphatase
VNPRVRLVGGLAALAVTAARVNADGVGPLEAAAFRSVNHLPDPLRAPVWVVMQGGNLVAAPLAAVAARRAGRPDLARRLLAGGSATWLLTKVVKRGVGRPRPSTLLTGTRVRGRPPSGLGFVSGHAGVVTALTAAALPELGPSGRRAALAGATAVGLARLYVGAHLPLDVVGGVALGIAVEAAVELAEDYARASAAAGSGSSASDRYPSSSWAKCSRSTACSP